MTGLVSKLIIPPQVQAIWAIVKPLLPYIAGLALLVAAYWWADDRGRSAQKAKDAVQIADSQTNVTTLSANLKTEQAQIATQNASIDALRKAGDAKAAAALVERDKALKDNKALTDQAKALAASASRPSGKPCGVSDTLKRARDL